MQNFSGSASYDRAPNPPELPGLSAPVSIPPKLQFTISWNYISQVAQGVKNAVDSATALVLSPDTLPAKNSPADVNEPKWEMVIPKMSRPAKPANPVQPRVAEIAAPTASVEDATAANTNDGPDLTLLRQLAERYRTLLLTMAIGGVFGLVLVWWAGGAAH